MESQRRAEESMSILERGVRLATQAIQDAGEQGFTDIGREFGRVLNQHAGEQTNRMAMMVIAMRFVCSPGC